jgi:heme-degrading monooxygenase HmoA
MITRIVKLSIADEFIEEFRSTFKNNRERISSFPGCEEVRLVFDVNQPNIHFTISIWHSTVAIENYRKSEIFQGIWSTVKPWFDDKPEAWSTISF